MRRHEEHEPTKGRQGRIGARAEKIGEQVIELRLRERARIVRVGSHRVIESREEVVHLLRSDSVLVNDGLVHLMGFQFAIDEYRH